MERTGYADIMDQLNETGLFVVQVDYAKRGYHCDVRMENDRVRDLAEALKTAGFFLEFVTAVHVTPAVQVVYQYAHFETPFRINAKTYLSESQSLPTISDIYQGASWHERETRDFYGVLFEGHDDMRPLLLADEDWNLKPLLKSEQKVKRSDEISWNVVTPKELDKALKN